MAYICFTFCSNGLLAAALNTHAVNNLGFGR